MTTATPPRTIRIASRTSPLAMWQTNLVKQRLEAHGYTCEIIPLESTGDLKLDQPIYALGISGVFTKQLDIALINNQADIAVHSLKDVPTNLAQGLMLCAVLERGASEDVVILKDKSIIEDSNNSIATIATSSLRRRAQWLSKFPMHTMVPIRGNVQTRMRKFREDPNMSGVIFAKAGLERMNLLPSEAVVLSWMLPAPAQGTIGIASRDDDAYIIEACEKINNTDNFKCATVERQFLNTLMGGCSVPVSALAKRTGNTIEIEGAVHSFDGSECYKVLHFYPIADYEMCGRSAANQLLSQPGAAALMDIIRNKKWDETDTVN